MRRLLYAALVLAAPVAASSQQITGALHGRVLDERGQALADVRVSITRPGFRSERIVTDGGGRFRVIALPPGVFAVRMTRIGYRPLVIEGVTVRLGQNTMLGEIALQRQVSELPPLVVTATHASIDPRTTALDTDLSAAIVERLPVGRDYRSLITFLPQANESFHGDGINIAGSTGLESAYFVDGVHVTDPYQGDGGIVLPLNFIAHLQLKAGGYEAEYGRALGGIVNLVTRSGGDSHESSAFGYFTGSALASSTARGLVDRGRGNFRRYDAGVSLGGPVVRDRLWYFLAYDAQVEQQNVEIPGSGSAIDRALTHRFAAKMDWRLSPEMAVTLTAVGDPSTRDIVGNPFFATLAPAESILNADPFLGVWNQGGAMVALNGRRLVGDRWLLEGMLSRLVNQQRNGPRTSRGRTNPLFTDAVTATWSGGYGNFWNRASTRTAASLTAMLHHEDHSTKGGVLFEENGLDDAWRWLASGPDNAGWMWRTGPDAYLTFPLDFQGRVTNRVVSAYLQGSYLVTPWIRINPGFRWDGQFFSGPGGRGGSIMDQLQPRLGLVMYPGRASQKLTATFGRFYEQLSTNPLAFWYGGFEQDLISYPHDPRADPSGGTLFRSIYGAASDLRGQHYDEFTLGYERALGGAVILRARGIHRVLREILTTADSLVLDSPAPSLIGANPGRDPAAFLPRPKATYKALELSAQKVDPTASSYALAYVLSRHHGNYVGLYDQDAGVGNPHGGTNYMNPAELENSEGPLPNDRTHVFKAFGSYRLGARLTVGSSLTLQSGTPLSYLGTNPIPGYSFDFVFLRPRGAAGRTPWIRDANVHFTYEVHPRGASWSSAVMLDIFHLFSDKRPVRLEQRAFLAVDPATGDQIDPNPLYGRALLRQAPMIARIGVQVARRP